MSSSLGLLPFLGSRIMFGRQFGVGLQGREARTALFELRPAGVIRPVQEPPPAGFNQYAIYEEQPCRYKDGCSEIARLYADLCDRHALEVYGLELRPSKIPNAGLGLFATRRIPAGDTIDMYEGDWIPCIQGGRTNPRTYEIVCGRHFINAASTQSCLARYLNYAPDDQANCRFHKFFSWEHSITVRAVRDILPDEELTVYYGRYYYPTAPSEGEEGVVNSFMSWNGVP